MKVTDHVYAKEMQFLGGKLIRTVYVYLVTGSERTVLIDTGVLPSRGDILRLHPRVRQRTPGSG